ncbi:MAG: FtsW/RodA/SpoVE family cell cycle protein, partial [Erysipelothrix sp.]
MNKFINESKRQFTVDRVLTVLLIALALISFVSIYMARPLMNVHEAKTIVQKQIMWYSIGIVTVIALL